MPDVSRVEYDAALKRVQESRACSSPCPLMMRCHCRRLTLAALGLACPICESGWTYHHACPDRGSGVDGGTA